MRKLLLAFLICTSTAAFAQKTNFSGNWKLDTTKTQFGQAPKYMIPWKIKVDQQADDIVIMRTPLDTAMQEQAVVKETLNFNGSVFQQLSGGKNVTTKIVWPDDHSFTLTRNGSLNATETWTLEDDGKTLFIDRFVEQTSNGFKYEIKCYYDKQ
jgi:hypothetical protein